MYHAVIINPAAGKSDQAASVSARFTAAFSDALIDGGISITQCAGHATQLVREIRASHTSDVVFYACGGDGTLNEVVCGAAGERGCCVTHYPIGSGNDFIKSLGVPALDYLDVSKLIRGRRVPVDLIEGKHGFALNICTTGLDARIARDMAGFKKLPLVTGKASYMMSVGLNLVRGLGEHCRVSVDGVDYSGSYTMVVVANACYYGGSFHPVPDARWDDRILDVLLVKAVKRLKAASLLNLYKNGRYAEIPEIITRLTAKEVAISADRDLAINYDGEIRTDKSVYFKLSEHRICFVVP